MPTSNLQPVRFLDPDCCYKFTCLMANSANPDRLASDLKKLADLDLQFAKARHIQIQQDNVNLFFSENRIC